MKPEEMGMTCFQNEHCDYPDSKLWDMSSWAHRQSKIWSLGLWITEHSAEITRRETQAMTFCDDREDGVFEYKVHANIYADVLESWEKQGMLMRRGEMANACWFALYPKAMAEGRLRDPKVVIVQHSADYSDPNWMMKELEYYRDYSEAAIAAGDVIMLYVATDGPDRFNTFINVNTELASVLHFSPVKVYLDVSPVYRLGEQLKNIPEFNYTEESGEPLDPDACVEKLGNHFILDVSGRWANTTSNLVRSLQSDAYGHPLFKMEELIHSDCGRIMAKGVRLEYDYTSGKDPGLLAHWEQMGIVFEEHFTNGERWVTYTPVCMKEHPERKIPLVMTFIEVVPVNPYLDLQAISYFYEYFPLVADGKTALLFYAMESPEDNDFAVKLIEEACALYPIDETRIYVTGHSHNGHFASEFARRHTDMVAAVASLGMEHGIPLPEVSHEVVKLEEADIERAALHDLPQININGFCESEIAWREVDSDMYHANMTAIQRRMRASRCPVPSRDEIRAARQSENYVTRMLGFPTDTTDLQVVYGRECWIGDVFNVDGKNHIRFVTIERMVHIPSPQMPFLSWNFMSRFARNRKTGEVIELY